ncbi:MAG: helix-turn-helix transcriptional regulator [Cytophagales bacterium]|nr:helix-turn-helix transcriptional regulator [Cytophagales bacterium]
MQNPSYWQSLSDTAALAVLGNFIKTTRLSQRMTQADLAKACGLHRETLLQIEKGEGGTMQSFIRILRMLGELPKLQSFEVEIGPTPLQLANLVSKVPKRASKPRKA